MKEKISGLHHVTAIAGPPQRNVDFYADLLGLRLVKKTVNFDDPGTYHLYYGDEAGHPGTIMTFFPWDNAFPGKAGSGMTTATGFSTTPPALDYWMERFADHAQEFYAPVERFGQTVLTFEDPDGLVLELVADPRAAAHPGWASGSVPAEQAIRSFHSVTLDVATTEQTARLLTETFGYEALGEEDGRLRFQAPGEARGNVIDLVKTTTLPGRMGSGTIHHVAFRARDEEEQQTWREAIAGLGFNVTPALDRQYFRSIYFREPGGVLFEIATDPPGFLRDESLDALGTTLKLPPWLEPQRERIEQSLAPLSLPTP